MVQVLFVVVAHEMIKLLDERIKLKNQSYVTKVVDDLEVPVFVKINDQISIHKNKKAE